MEFVRWREIRRHLLGGRLHGLWIVGSVVGILVLASVAFLLGMDVGLYEFPGWLVLPVVLGIVAGAIRAGLVPTVGSLWLIALWGHVFPPLVGYLTGEWSGGGRYTYPRLTGFAYGSARAELFGGLETALEIGLVLALVVGTVTYLTGALGREVVESVQSSW